MLTLNGVSKCAAEWAEELKIPPSMLRARKKNGWTDEEALNTPVPFKKCRFCHKPGHDKRTCPERIPSNANP